MTGNRLAGDHEGADRHTADDRAETRLDGDLARRFTEYRETHGLDKADVLRAALDAYLPASENSPYLLPRDPELAEAYLALAGDEKRVLTVEMAEDILCQESHPNTPKELIREDVLQPLSEIGFVGVKGGRVGVHPLTLSEEFEPSATESAATAD